GDLFGDVVIGSSSTSSFINGNLNLGAGNLAGDERGFKVAPTGTSSPGVVITANISNGGLYKSGTGMLELRSANSYVGLTEVADGVLVLNNPDQNNDTIRSLAIGDNYGSPGS